MNPKIEAHHLVDELGAVDGTTLLPRKSNPLNPARLARQEPDDTQALLERLRATEPRYSELTGKHQYDVFPNRDGPEAADIIEALLAEIEQLKAASNG